MIEAGRSIRGAEGPGALARRLLPKLLGNRNYAIDSVRHPKEVEVLRGLDLSALTQLRKTIALDAGLNECPQAASAQRLGNSLCSAHDHPYLDDDAFDDGK